MLMYTALSGSRQAAARRDQQGVAITRLAELADERSEIEQRRGDLASNDAEIAKFTELRDHPDKTDKTIPSWSMLIRDGLVRACTPQGSFKRKEIWIIQDFKATGARLSAALFVGVLTSILVGLLMGCYDPVEAFLLPPFAFFSKVPTTAVLPIFFVIVQINFSMYIAIIAFGMLPSLGQAISASVRKDVPEELVFKAYTLGASQFELIWNVIFKQVLPRILDAIRLQIGPGVRESATV